MPPSDGRVPTIHYEYPYFEDYVEPKGALAVNKESHACFYYAMLAAKARGMAGTGIDSQIIQYRVGDTPPEWLESRDEEIAKGVALVYGLDSPERFLRADWKKRAWAQCSTLGIDLHPEILNVRPGATKLH